MQIDPFLSIGLLFNLKFLSTFIENGFKKWELKIGGNRFGELVEEIEGASD